MSLLGLLRHLAKIEHHWFRRTLAGQTDLAVLYSAEEDPDLDFDGAVGTDDCVTDAWESWRREVAHARESLPATPTSSEPSSRASRGRREESSCT